MCKGDVLAHTLSTSHAIACVCKGDVLAHTPLAIVLEHNVEPTLWHCSHIGTSDFQQAKDGRGD